MTTEIVEYSKTEAALAGLREIYKGVVYDVSTPYGMAVARSARKELRDYRLALDEVRVSIKAPALKRCQLIDAEARRITQALSALEDPIDAQIKTEEKRREDERIAVQRAEAERIAAEERARREAEEAKLAAERAEIARRVEELNRAEAARVEAERATREKIEAEERAARLRIEEQERAARLAREEADRIALQGRLHEEAVARALRETEEAKLKAERDKIDAARREVEAQQAKERLAEEERQRALRETEEAKAREERRLQDERLDAIQILQTFVQRYGRLKEFATIAAQIAKFLEETKA